MRHKFLFVLLFLVILHTASLAQTDQAPIGTNMAGIASWGTQHPFTNVFRTARPWISNCDGCDWGEGGPLDLTPEGWVASLQAGQYADTIILDSLHFPQGEYVVLYEGEGMIDFFLGNTQVISEAPGRIVIIPDNESGIFLRISETNPANYIRNIRVLMPGFEETYEAQPFNPQFLAMLAPFASLRFMDWMSTNDSTVSAWDDRPKLTDANFHTKGVALEVMVQLANTLQADPWFTLPHLATDDYVTQFATYVRDNLDPSLTVYIEYSNETWNGIFDQAQYVQEQGLALALSDNPFQAGLFYHAYRATQMFDIFESVFGGTDRLMRVLASQAANPWTGEQVLDFENAYQNADALAIAPYFGGFLGSPDTADEVSQWSIAEVIAALEAQIPVEILDWMTGNKTLTDDRGVELLAYEGGQHLAGYNGAENNDDLTNLFIATNRDWGMYDLYIQYLQQWSDVGGGLFMNFSDVGGYSKWGSWGVLEAIDQPASTAPKYSALLDFIGVEIPQDGEQLQNGGFEIAGATDKAASNWDEKNLVGKDKRLCNKDGKPPRSHTGECAFQMDGTPGVNSSIKQTVSSAVGSTGDTFTLSAWVYGKNLAASGKVQAKIVLSDSNKLKITLSLAPGTYEYTELTDATTLTANVSKVQAKIQVKSGSGKVRIDDVSLLHTSADGLIPLPPSINSALQSRR